MEELLRKEANYCGNRGLYVNENGQLMDPVQDEEVIGVGVPEVVDLDKLFGVLNKDN